MARKLYEAGASEFPDAAGVESVSSERRHQVWVLSLDCGDRSLVAFM
jgi:hypothetical protein